LKIGEGASMCKNNLKLKRAEKGIGAIALARAVGISYMSYHRYETGKRTPSVSTAHIFARELGSTVAELFPSQPNQTATPNTNRVPQSGLAGNSSRGAAQHDHTPRGGGRE
jgi:transcriptional regulator with XRE-family HTH domain